MNVSSSSGSSGGSSSAGSSGGGSRVSGGGGGGGSGYDAGFNFSGAAAGGTIGACGVENSLSINEKRRLIATG